MIEIPLPAVVLVVLAVAVATAWVTRWMGRCSRSPADRADPGAFDEVAYRVQLLAINAEIEAARWERAARRIRRLQDQAPGRRRTPVLRLVKNG